MSKHTYPTIEHIQEVTKFKKKKAAQGALEALIWLDRGAPHKFDGLKGNYLFAMDHFLTPVEETQFSDELDCGTACCIAGAIFAFAKDMNGNKTRDDDNMDKFFATSPANEEGDYDLDKELYDLFYANHDYDLASITAKDAAKALRKYLRKGVVDWSFLSE